MKKNYLLLALLLVGFGIQAQYIYNDFDANQNEPFSGATDVLFVENASNLQNINIFSVSGQVIYQSEQIGNSIDLNDFPVGMYTMLATGNDGTQYFAKFMVK
jgi:hypothetical protein